jgi:hypothetical protein
MWLQLRFGWQQLYFDCQNLWDVIKEVAAKTPRHSFTRGSWEPQGIDYYYPPDFDHVLAEVLDDDNATYNPFLEHTYLNAREDSGMSVDIKLYGSYSHKAGTATDSRIDDTLLQRVGHAFETMNIGRAIWESTHYTFVLDNFVDLGMFVSIAGTDPAVYTRNWRTLHVPEKACRCRLSTEFPRIDLRNSLEVSGDIDTKIPEAYLLKYLESDDDTILMEPRGWFESYIRSVYTDSSSIPLVFPKGALVLKWVQITDYIALLVSRRKIRGR